MPQARGALFGLTRKSGAAELARAALEAVGYQTRDLLEAMRRRLAGAAAADTVLRVDGGMAASDVTMQFVADILAAPVDRPGGHGDDRARRRLSGGLAAGLCPEPAGFAATVATRAPVRAAHGRSTRERKWAGWRDAVAPHLEPAVTRGLAAARRAPRFRFHAQSETDRTERSGMNRSAGATEIRTLDRSRSAAAGAASRA